MFDDSASSSTIRYHASIDTTPHGTGGVHSPISSQSTFPFLPPRDVNCCPCQEPSSVSISASTLTVIVTSPHIYSNDYSNGINLLRSSNKNSGCYGSGPSFYPYSDRDCYPLGQQETSPESRISIQPPPSRRLLPSQRLFISQAFHHKVLSLSGWMKLAPPKFQSQKHISSKEKLQSLPTHSLTIIPIHTMAGIQTGHKSPRSLP